jgi:hypothetical protein
VGFIRRAAGCRIEKGEQKGARGAHVIVKLEQTPVDVQDYISHVSIKVATCFRFGLGRAIILFFP